MGPLFLCALLHVSGLVKITSPPWLLHLSQLFIGLSLGAQFSGVDRSLLKRGAITSLFVVSYMLLVTLVFAFVLNQFLPASLAALFISFAPGGVTEMNLIALSLNLSPVIVATHHLVRIIATVWITSAFASRVIGTENKRD